MHTNFVIGTSYAGLVGRATFTGPPLWWDVCNTWKQSAVQIYRFMYSISYIMFCRRICAPNDDLPFIADALFLYCVHQLAVGDMTMSC